MSEQLVVVGVGGGGGPRRNVELVEDVAHVPVDRPLAQEQLGRDGLVGLAGGDQAKHLKLARREPMWCDRRCALAERVEPSKVRRGSQPFKDGSGGVELELARPRRPRGRGMPVPSAPARVRPRKAPRPAATPRDARRSETERGLSVAFGQLDRASRLRGHRTAARPCRTSPRSPPARDRHCALPGCRPLASMIST